TRRRARRADGRDAAGTVGRQPAAARRRDPAGRTDRARVRLNGEPGERWGGSRPWCGRASASKAPASPRARTRTIPIDHVNLCSAPGLDRFLDPLAERLVDVAPVGVHALAQLVAGHLA